MQLSELVGQYHNANARPEMTGSKGIRKLVSTLHDMKSGNIFEGTVNSVRGQKVTLGLSNGQEVSARMEGKVKLNVGQSMFFQVKSNDGVQIEIRPYTVEGNSMNLTLMEALKTANLIVDGRNLSMVNSMMEEQMSIDRGSLSQMARVVANNPDIDVKTLVQMQKLDLPISTQMAAQFENYQTDQRAIGQALSDFMDTLPEALANGELSAEQLQQTAADVIRILTEGLPEEIEIPEWAKAGAPDISGGAMADGAELDTEAGFGEAGSDGAPGVGMQENGERVAQTAGETEAGAQTVGGTETVAQGAGGTEANAQTAGGMDAGAQGIGGTDAGLQGAGGASYAVANAEAESRSLPAHTIGSLLSADQIQTLSAQLNSFPGLMRNPALFSNGQLLRTGSAVALLDAVKNQLQFGGQDKGSLLSLLSGKEFQTLLKDAMEQQWMLKPEELVQKDKISRLYEKVEDQLNRLENVMRATGQQNEQVSNLASNIRSNVEFMDQINQAYTYVQIPLKMTGQNASGELYVYTNKKNLAEGKDELSAFLHLDMDHLGSTDVSVKMHGRNVRTNFYFDNDETFALVQAHVPDLEERLKAKGYNCEVKVVNESQKVNFVDDFLKKDQPSKGLVHRYSFDMKA
jgi:translation initiation factor IF-1